jgi:hypothetical protein
VPLFNLAPTPASQSHPDWAASTHHGSCRVCAPDERRARLYAANAFFNAAAPRSEAGLQPASPWTSRQLVRADALIGWSIGAVTEGTIMVPANPADPHGVHRVLRKGD